MFASCEILPFLVKFRSHDMLDGGRAREAREPGVSAVSGHQSPVTHHFNVKTLTQVAIRRRTRVLRTPEDPIKLYCHPLQEGRYQR